MSGGGTAARRGVPQPVLLVLVLASLAAALALGFVADAPNRLVSGTGIPLAACLQGARGLLLLPALVLALGACLRPAAQVHAAIAIAAALWLAALLWLAGDQAARQAGAGSGYGRTAFGAGFWVLAVLAWLAAADALRRLPIGAAARSVATLALLLPPALLAASGALHELSLAKEYRNRTDVFDAALWRHLQIVALALAASLALGVPLGVAALRRPRLAAPLFALLNLVQTLPSIALFGLLMAPLAWLATALPALGVHGVGLAPALIALVLYALLPVVQGTLSGLREVPAAVTEAAAGMGMTPRQVFWRVEVPLALPLLLSGLRVGTVQSIGLAVVAALIGAGGLGALMFQGLSGGALDLVLLGVLPVIALAALADGALALAAAAAGARREPQ